VIPWLLAAQLAALDSNYASTSLRSFVAEAARRNRDVPTDLRAYRAVVESEIAVVARLATGNEAVVSLEQIHSEVRWRVPGSYEQRVNGFRTQAMSQLFTSLGFMRDPWTAPILYGNRLSILFGRDTSRAAVRRQLRRRMTAVHPLATDRDQYYRFQGGDTVITMRTGGQALPIVRVLVEPRADAPPRTVAFRGTLELDATRHHLVRMRGHFVTISPPRPSWVGRALAATGFEAIAFIELENAEYEGRYWLPRYQRVEAHAAWTAATDARSVLRVVSRYRDLQVNDTTLTVVVDSLIATPYALRRAPADSLGAFVDWRFEIGDLTRETYTSDFDDLAPDVWRPTGPPRTALRVGRLSDAVHVNRVEGVFTGWGIEHRFRDRAPGVVARASAGWAWHERRIRGRASLERVRGPWTASVRAGRSLDITNDFRHPFDSGSTLAAIFGIDDYDYVDRRVAALGLKRSFPRAQAVWRVETGPARDAGAGVHLARGVFRGDSGFRTNRGVDPGAYWRTWSLLQWRPDVGAEFMRTGVGGQLSVEHATGDLSFARLDARVVARRNRGPWTAALRADAGLLWGDSLPPQQLYEVGRNNQGLPGYRYKEFVGDRALVARGLVTRRLPVLQAPIPLGRLLLPGVSPALAAGVQTAWTTLSSAAAASANLRLGVVPLARSDSARATAEPGRPAAGETDGLRASLRLGLRLFGGSVGVGVARPLGRRGPWKFRFEFGEGL
jgi:hypothetical protein